MRRRRHRSSSPSVDLTSLLDVIFIILFAVMMGQNQASGDLEEREKGISQREKAAEAAQSRYEHFMETEGSIGQYVYVVSISVPISEEIHKRKITVLSEDEDPVEYDLIGKDTSAYDRLEDYLEEYLSSRTDSPVILALNTDGGKILYRDEHTITDMLFKLSADHPNVSVKGHLGEVE